MIQPIAVTFPHQLLSHISGFTIKLSHHCLADRRSLFLYTDNYIPIFLQVYISLKLLTQMVFFSHLKPISRHKMSFNVLGKTFYGPGYGKKKKSLLT